MNVNRVSAEEYENIVRDAGVVYNLAQFNELNKYKVDNVEYLVVSKGKSPRFAVCLGIENNEVRYPFSAPFALPVETKRTKNKLSSSVDNCQDAVKVIEEYCIQQSYKSLQYIFPPTFYSEHMISAWINALYNLGYYLANIDINFSIELNESIIDNYMSTISHNARNTLKKALSAGLTILCCSNDEEIARAYKIIEENKLAKRYPLHMSYTQVCDTISFVPCDVFLVENNGEDVAAAFVYHVTETIVQVIYWGDKPGFSNLRPMNYLAYQLIQYYSKKGIKHIDIGPSTENSIPNYGLCDFKESIGCKRSLKFTMKKIL